jgi:hypothetical protein
VATTNRNFRIPDEDYASAMAKATQDGTNLTEVVIRALRAYVQEGADETEQPTVCTSKAADVAPFCKCGHAMLLHSRKPGGACIGCAISA